MERIRSAVFLSAYYSVIQNRSAFYFLQRFADYKLVTLRRLESDFKKAIYKWQAWTQILLWTAECCLISNQTGRPFIHEMKCCCPINKKVPSAKHDMKSFVSGAYVSNEIISSVFVSQWSYLGFVIFISWKVSCRVKRLWPVSLVRYLNE